MSTSFVVNIAVPCCCGKKQGSLTTNESNRCCETLLSTSFAAVDRGSSQTLLVAMASSVSMSLNRQLAVTGTSRVSHLGIFVPPSLIASTNIDSIGTRTCCEQLLVVNDEAVREKVSSDILSGIHPFLLEHGKLVGIVSICRGDKEQSAPADLVLIDVTSAPQHWLNDIKAALNGESMASFPTAVLNLIPVSSIVMTTEAADSLLSVRKRSSEFPTCPLCLHRIDPLRLGMPKPQNHQLCSKFCPSSAIANNGQRGDACQNQQFLQPWSPPSYCIACHVIHDRWKHYMSVANNSNDDDHESKDDTFCNQCAMQETLWVCLTCGFVGCGRYSHRHAAQHFEESGHPYSLELATLRVWDYAAGEFAHRGDLLDCPSVQRLDGHRYSGEHPSDGPCSDSFSEAHRMDNHVAQLSYPNLDKSSPKKANMIGEEYEALLRSALEDQAQHYQGEIARLRAELSAANVDSQTMTKAETEEISRLKADVARFRDEIDRLSRQLLDAQAQEAGYRADSQRLLREQSVAKDLLDKIKEEAARENMEGQVQVDDLEQQVADLTANLKMRHKFCQDHELSNAQIFGTTSSASKSGKRGKKFKRLFRK